MKFTDRQLFFSHFIFIYFKNIWGNLLTRMYPNVYWPCRTSWGIFLLARSCYWVFIPAWGQRFSVSVEPYWLFSISAWQILHNTSVTGTNFPIITYHNCHVKSAQCDKYSPSRLGICNHVFDLKNLDWLGITCRVLARILEVGAKNGKYDNCEILISSV